MAAIVYRTFRGEIPRKTPELLPENNAQYALNCDFSEGRLRPLKGGTLFATLSTNPTKGIFTTDGLNFFSWEAETLTFDSPIIGDAYERMYYLQPSVGELRVASKSLMDSNGGAPSVSYLVGVPRPTVAPTLRLVDRTSLPDYPHVTVAAEAWWDYNGTAYSRAAVSLSTVTAFKSYTFTTPALPGSPPENVTPVLVVKLQMRDDDNSNAVIMEVTARVGAAGRTDALPGTVELSATVSGTTATLNLLWGVAESIAYVYTYENTWNEESAPSPPALIPRTYLQDVEITATAGTFTNYRPFLRYNFYRTYGTNVAFLRGGRSSTATMTDSSRTPPSIGSQLSSVDYFPPETGLEGLVLAPGGWVVAFKDNQLFKSAPYKPHAFPYTEKFPTAIRGVAVGAQAIVVTCADGVYLIAGTSPSKSGYVKLGAPQAGIAQRSMAQIDGAVAYASQDGIVLVEGSAASLEMSHRLFTREKWRAIFGDILGDYSLRLAYHDGGLVGSSNTEDLGFLLRLDEEVGQLTRTDARFDTMMPLPILDALYYTSGTGLYRYQSGSDLSMDWWGRDWLMPWELSMGVGYINCSGTVRVRVYADDVVVFDQSLTTGIFRGIEQVRSRKWSVRLSGTGCVVNTFALAQTVNELKNVIQ